MSTPPSPLPEQPAPSNHTWWQRHGTTAQWVALIVALIGAISSPWITIHYRNVDSTTKSSDEHVNALIDGKLNSAVKDINDNIDKKLSPIGNQLTDLGNRVAKLEGRFQQLDSEQQKLRSGLDQQKSLAKLYDPNRVLTIIRTEIDLAEREKKEISAERLVDYKNAVRGLPEGSVEYWTTVAAIINYQSLQNQMRGLAPDPRYVSRPCAIYNSEISGTISKCRVELDGNSFNRVLFMDSVVLYHGGKIDMHNVAFVNCRFVIDIPPKPATEPQRNLLFALLDSKDQTHVTVAGM